VVSIKKKTNQKRFSWWWASEQKEDIDEAADVTGAADWLRKLRTKVPDLVLVQLGTVALGRQKISVNDLRVKIKLKINVGKVTNSKAE